MRWKQLLNCFVILSRLARRLYLQVPHNFPGHIYQLLFLPFYLKFARVVGLEPTANGFGDHYSTN